jgi:hypothetical protein
MLIEMFICVVLIACIRNINSNDGVIAMVHLYGVSRRCLGMQQRNRQPLLSPYLVFCVSLPQGMIITHQGIRTFTLCIIARNYRETAEDAQSHALCRQLHITLGRRPKLISHTKLSTWSGEEGTMRDNAKANKL